MLMWSPLWALPLILYSVNGAIRSSPIDIIEGDINEVNDSPSNPDRHRFSSSAADSTISNPPFAWWEILKHADPELDKLFGRLSRDGRHDSLWLDHTNVNIDSLLLPDLPDDFPEDVLQFIEMFTAEFDNIHYGECVNRIRRKYPSRLRRLYPHCKHVAKLLMESDVLKPYGSSLDAILYALGINVVTGTFWAKLPSYMTSFDKYHSKTMNEAGPHSYIPDWINEGQEQLVWNLLDIPAYVSELSNDPEMLLIALCASLKHISEDLFEHITSLPCLAHYQRNACPWRNVLLNFAIRSGRISDLADHLLSKKELDLLIDSTPDSDALLDALLQIDTEAVQAFLDLCTKHDKLNTFMSVKIEKVFKFCCEELIEDSSNPKTLTRCLLADPYFAPLISQCHSLQGKSLMHFITDYGHFEMMPLLFQIPGVDMMKMNGQGPESALRNLVLHPYADFVASLPEPRKASIRRFPEEDWVFLLHYAVRENRLENVQVICDLVPELIGISYGGLTALERSRSYQEIHNYLHCMNRMRSSISLIPMESSQLKSRFSRIIRKKRSIPNPSQ